MHSYSNPYRNRVGSAGLVGDTVGSRATMAPAEEIWDGDREQSIENHHETVALLEGEGEGEEHPKTGHDDAEVSPANPVLLI